MMNFNIQLFADAQTNTTGTMSVEMKTFYEKRLIDQAEPRLVHDQFADYYPVPQNGGKTIEFRKYDSLPKASTPLTEGVTPNGQALNVTSITSDLHQYGGWTPLTDVLQMTAIDNNVVQATRVLASQAGRTMDSITRDVLAGGTNVIYAPKLGADGTETAVTSRKALDKSCTQTGITNWAAARAAYNMGAKRVVLAREMSLQDIATLRDKTPPELEIEAFVHGAMCMSISGRCLLSNYMAGRDANRGQCAQPCRWKYYLSEETRPGQLYEIGENENGSYILNANDLCTAPFIDLICKAGVDSLKIEGRAKTFYYVASVTAAYRKALDQYLTDPLNDNFELSDDILAELTRTSHRHYSPGFYFGREQARQATDSATYIREWEFVGTVESWENGVASCQQRGKWSLGDTLEVLCPDGRSIPLHPEWIKNEAGESVESTPHAMEKYTIPTPELPPMSLLRRKVEALDK